MRAAAYLEPLLLVELVVLAARVAPALAPARTGADSPPRSASCWSSWRSTTGLSPGCSPSQRPRSRPALVLAALVAAGLLGYLRLLAKAYSPALAEARLQALQARIRPHFLFNSLNAVLSLIRRDPRRAERALEDLADLFRTLMSDSRGSSCASPTRSRSLERYAGLEQLRLGERLRITWELDAAPSDALLPPLVLQPLLENAVYHGVEPGTAAGEVVVRIERRGDRVLACIENPYVAGSATARGQPHGARQHPRAAGAFLRRGGAHSHERGRIALPCRNRDSVQVRAGMISGLHRRRRRAGARAAEGAAGRRRRGSRRRASWARRATASRRSSGFPRAARSCCCSTSRCPAWAAWRSRATSATSPSRPRSSS